MKALTKYLANQSLDFAAALACGHKPSVFVEPDCGQSAVRPLKRWCGINVSPSGHTVFKPSEYWTQGGPIIERERLCLRIGHDGVWLAFSMQNYNDDQEFMHGGTTPLEAAMRCFVASKLGNEVDIPVELLS